MTRFQRWVILPVMAVAFTLLVRDTFIERVLSTWMLVALISQALGLVNPDDLDDDDESDEEEDDDEDDETDHRGPGIRGSPRPRSV